MKTKVKRMKYMLKISSFFLCIQIVSGFGILNEDVSYSETVCSIINDISKNENRVQEVLIASSYKNKSNSDLGDIVKCIGSENPVVIAKLDEPIKFKDSRTASIMVVEFESIAENDLFNIIDKQLKSNIWNHMSKLIVVNKGTTTTAQRIKLQNYLISFGFFNVAIVHEINDTIHVDYSKSIKNGFHSTSVTKNGQKFFPEKSKNLQSYTLKIPIIDQTGTVNVDSNNVESPMLYFLNILQEKMNVSTQFRRIYHPGAFASFWFTRGMDLTFNTIMTFDVTAEIRAPKLITYKQNGLCAIIPFPEKTAISDVIFLKPFDIAIRICLTLTITACILIWWLFYNRGTQNSHWLLMFGMFAMFVGQGVEMRQTRRYVLLILLQLIVVMFFILSNGYQGVITAFMIQPEHEIRLKTINDLVNSNYKIVLGETVQHIIKNSPEFQPLESKIEMTDLFLTPQKLDEISEKKLVMIMKCKSAELVTTVYGYSYYILQQRLITYLEQLEASYLNPLIEKMQYYMDWSFQSGLQQAWELYTWNYHKIIRVEEHNVEYLKLKDLSQVFYVLFIGYGLAVLVILIELFFHDFIENFSLKYQTSKIRKFINRIGTVRTKKITSQRRKSKKPRPHQPKIRWIDVRPINQEI